MWRLETVLTGAAFGSTCWLSAAGPATQPYCVNTALGMSAPCIGGGKRLEQYEGTSGLALDIPSSVAVWRLPCTTLPAAPTASPLHAGQ